VKRGRETRIAILREIGQLKDHANNLDTQIQMGTFGDQLSATDRYRSEMQALKRRIEMLESRLKEFDKPARADVIK